MNGLSDVLFNKISHCYIRVNQIQQRYDGCIEVYCIVKNFGSKKPGKLQQFTKFFANFHYFLNNSHANGLRLAKVFSAKLPTVLIPQTFLQPTFLLSDNCKIFLNFKLF